MLVQGSLQYFRKKIPDFPRSFCKILLNLPCHSYNPQLGFYHFFGQLWSWEALTLFLALQIFGFRKYRTVHHMDCTEQNDIPKGKILQLLHST